MNIQTPVFYKVHSRLGLLNAPNKSTEVNVGVEKGPDAVLADLPIARGSATHSLSYVLPDDIDPSAYFDHIAQETEACAQLITRTSEPSQRIVVVGGDHGLSCGSVLAMMRRYGAEKIGYIQFDSHADLHEIRTSPSGNFHGMWLRALLTGIGHARLDCLVREHLPSSAVRYYGNLDLEDAERVFIEKNNIDVWDSQRLQDMRSGSDNLVNFIQRYTHVHVSFDIDVFDRALAPATGTPAPAGMQKDEIFPLLRTLARAPSLSVDLVEVNPQKKGAAETIALAQEVLRLLLGYETATIDPL